MPVNSGSSAAMLEAVERLREQRAAADGADRSRTALLLGLAIADLAEQLPDDDARLPELAEEGLLHLAEGATSADTPAWVAAVKHGREVLHGRLRSPEAIHPSPAAATTVPTGPQGVSERLATQPVPESPDSTASTAQPTRIRFRPEALSLLGGNFAGKPDWGMLRNVMATIPLLVQGLPEGHPHRIVLQSMTGMLDLVDASESGRWTPQHDHTLADLRRVSADVAAAGGSLDPALSALIRLLPAVMRGDRYISAVNSPQAADRPEPTALDEVVADLEEAVALLHGAGPPLDALIGGTRLRIAGLLLARVHLDVNADGSRNRSWFDDATRRLRRARDHLVEAPPEFADQVQPGLARISASIAHLEQVREEGDHTGTDDGSPPAPAPERSVDPSDRQPRSTPAPGPAGEQARPGSLPEGFDWPSGADMQVFQRGWEGLRILLPALPDDDQARAPLQLIVRMADLVEASVSGRWTIEQDHALANLRQAADRMAADGEELNRSEAALLGAGLAMARGLRCTTLAASPRPEDWPDTAELSEVVAELEAALELIPEDDPSSTALAVPVRAMAGSLLLSLAAHKPDNNDDGGDDRRRENKIELLARAREHFAGIPPDTFPQLQYEIDEIALLEQRLGGGGGEKAEQGARPFSGDRDDSFDAGEGDISRLAAMVERARRTRDSADLDAAINALRTVRRGLPAGHPEHATVLTWLADMSGLRAALTNSPHDLAEALDAAIEAVRVAPRRSVKGAATTLVHLLGRVVTEDRRVGPFEQAEAVLTSALAAADPSDTWLALILTLGIGGARSLRSRARGDEGLRRLARQAFADAEQMLPESMPTDEWFMPAWLLFVWTSSQASLGGDAEAGAIAARLAGRLEKLLTGNPELADQVAGRFGGPTPLNLGSGGHGVLQALRVMKELNSLMSGSGPIASMVRNNPAQFRMAQFAAAQAPVIPPPAEETRRVAGRGLDRAAFALRTDRANASARRPLSRTDRPPPEPLRAAVADLHAALAGGLDDDSLRHQVHGTLGVCLAELYWLGEANRATDPPGRGAEPSADSTDSGDDAVVGRPGGLSEALASTLIDAIGHLERSLAGSEHSLPTVERANLMDVLARCYRESDQPHMRENARYDAERTARAALRELARCVLVADDVERALDVAARANDIVARVVGWCLADDRAGAAVEVAEAGRSLVLASVVLAGRVEEVLRGAGEHAVADAWRLGDAQGRLAGLNGLWDTRHGRSLLTTPTTDDVSAMLLATAAIDGIVYLVPPTQNSSPGFDDGPIPASGSPARALIVRPGLAHQIERVDLPDVIIGAGTPLDDYVTAFGAALDDHDPSRRHPDGFRGTPLGQAWANALDNLGAWAYDHLVDPLIKHTRSWSLDRPPHLALVPLGEFAAIPFAAAWTADPAVPGERRYSIHDLVLTHTVSTRLLAEVVRRPRRRLTERVVLIADPTGEFPYARATAKALGDTHYPGAEVYGRRNAPHGPPTTAALLAALPGRGQAGASLLHLSTHATTEPTARLKTSDGWLPLNRILEQARDRPPDSPGGLIITNACLTDSTRSHYDESVTLATSLLAAGATAVVGTRWPIDDDTTAVLTHRLHYHLHMGRPPAEALRLAQLDLIAPDPSMRLGLHPHLAAIPDSRLSHPASWAGYVHHGI
jgi:hypothetical protein